MRTRWMLALAATMAAGCGLGSKNKSCEIPEPSQHRAVTMACDDVRPAGGVTNSGGGLCTDDADCTDGQNGRCLEEPRGGAYCTYDECFADDDCGGKVCECGGGSGGANSCRAGNCATDADCGAGGYCSPSYGECGNYLGVVAYYCRTCEDTCLEDADCPEGPSYCAYDPALGHWACSSSQCVG